MRALSTGQLSTSEHDSDIARKRAKRSAAAAVHIPPIVDIKRREQCLADPEKFLWTYGKADPTKSLKLQRGLFWLPFSRPHLRLITELYERAKTGGDKALAAPRGLGKTTVIFWMIIFIILAKFRQHPCAVGATNAKAKEKLFDPVCFQLTFNPLLFADFPEVCAPLRDLDGAAQRRRKQHVGGVKTHIEASVKKLVLPYVEGLEYYENGVSPYGFCSFKYYGLDAAIRGERHDFIAIDDPETRDVAFNRERNQDVEDLIDGDVAGLSFGDSSAPRIIITTIQNDDCYSYRVTSRDVAEGGRPTFDGERFGVIEKWPVNRDMWSEYVGLRQQAQADGDKDGLRAVEFYKTHFEEMNDGAVLNTPDRYDHNNPAELDALQAFFNRVADWGIERVMAELQNDPKPTERDQTIGLTPGLVQQRISGFNENVLPTVDSLVTCGLDIGKYYSYWVKVAWFGNRIGCVISYGVMQTPGMKVNTQDRAIEIALLQSLLGWRVDALAENPPSLCLIDSGKWPAPVYEFCRQANGIFAPSKGWDPKRFRMPKEDNDEHRRFDMCWAHWLKNDNVWLYNVETEHWKNEIQQQFITPTFDDQNQFVDGSLSLYSDDDRKKHLSFSQHMVSEMRVQKFESGKGLRVKWEQRHKNNHWLDAIALAGAAAGAAGVRLIPKKPTPLPPPRETAKRSGRQNFKRRPGGWIQGAKRR